MVQKHIALINPRTVNKYYHLNLGGVDKLFAWFFRKFYDNTHFTYPPVFQPKNMSRADLWEGCKRVERQIYTPWNTVRRWMTSRVWHMPTLIANIVYSRRLVARGDLVPVGDEYDAPVPAGGIAAGARCA